MTDGPPPHFPTSLVARSDAELLRLALRAHLHQPAIALWRATEFVMLRDIAFGMPVLDLGCGTGEIARAVLRSHWPLDGLELVESEANEAARSGLFRTVLRGDATLIPFATGAFATIFSQSVLEHILDDVAVLREAARLLQPGGRIVFTVPSPAFRERIQEKGGARAAEQIDARLGHYHYRPLEEWQTLLRELGLEVVHTSGHLPAATQRAWEKLDALMVRRIAGRRLLDWLRRAHRQRLIPMNIWLALWTALLWRPFRRRTDNPGGYLIVAERRA